MHTPPTSLRTAIFGANVQTALREKPEEARAALVKMLTVTLESISATNGIKSEEGIARAAKRLTDEFGNFTLEDWKLCLYEMEAGRSLNHYNNTNLEWLIKCFQAYDQRKLAELRAYHNDEAQRNQDQTARFVKEVLQDVVQEMPMKRTLTDLLQKPPVTSWEEREAMARRDAHRREAMMKKEMRALLRAEYRAKKKNNPNS